LIMNEITASKIKVFAWWSNNGVVMESAGSASVVREQALHFLELGYGILEGIITQESL